MTNHYQTLGVSENATQDEIKKAYRSLANKHHPDKGGDQAVFKNISVAYDTIGDVNKRAEYDNQLRYGGATEHRFNTGNFQDFADIFGGNSPFGAHFGDIFGHQRGMRRNKDLNIQCQISFLDSYNGKQLEANYTLPSGKAQTVIINVPPGVGHGETIRYQGLGDDSVAGAPRGNLNVTVVVMPDANFVRQGDDLYTTLNISPIDAMIGCRKKVKFITGVDKELEIRAGIETGAEFATNGHGFSNPHTGRKGRFVTVIRIEVPTITNPDVIKKLKEIQDIIDTKS
jgi:curved DNA-binding protein